MKETNCTGPVFTRKTRRRPSVTQIAQSNMYRTLGRIEENSQMARLDRQIDIFVNRSWVYTRWQQYSTHLHTNNTRNNTINLGRVRAVPRLCELHIGICHTTEEKAQKNLSQGSRKVPAGTMKILNCTIRINRHTNKNT